MTRQWVLNLRVLTLASLVAVLLVGCGGGDYAEKAEAPEPAAKETPSGPEAEAAVLKVLVDADKLDGAEDKVVIKCAGCALAMDGSPEHKVDVQGYELHLCSEYCKENLEKNPTESLLAIQLPAL